jgi:hypothetical protein
MTLDFREMPRWCANRGFPVARSVFSMGELGNRFDTEEQEDFRIAPFGK